MKQRITVILAMLAIVLALTGAFGLSAQLNLSVETRTTFKVKDITVLVETDKSGESTLRVTLKDGKTYTKTGDEPYITVGKSPYDLTITVLDRGASIGICSTKQPDLVIDKVNKPKAAVKQKVSVRSRTVYRSCGPTECDFYCNFKSSAGAWYTIDQVTSPRTHGVPEIFQDIVKTIKVEEVKDK